MPDEEEPSQKRAKVAEDDIIDLMGDDDDIEPAAAPQNAPQPPLQPHPPIPAAAAANVQPAVEDASPAAPDCPPLHLLRTQGIPDWANEGFCGATLGELISGPIQWAMVMTFMVEFPWLQFEVPALATINELVFVHGQGANTAAAIAEAYPRALVHKPPLPHPKGQHHTKAAILYYPGRGMRDFGLKDAASVGSSAFEADLKDYVRELRLPAAATARALELISLHDFSPARAHLIASVPSYGRGFTGPQLDSYGHRKLRKALNSESFDPKFIGAPILSQCSSLGDITRNWLNDFEHSLSSGRVRGGGVLGPPSAGSYGAHLVWPTLQEIRDSLEGWDSGASYPPEEEIVLRDILMQRYRAFGGAPVGRQRAMPHLKSYLRYLGREIAFMFMGSHNLSKAAMGWEEIGGADGCKQVKILSYELGVLLAPSCELQYRKSRFYGFSCTDLTRDGAPMAGAEAASAVRFVQWQRGQPQEASVSGDVITVPLPVPYELPPEKYSRDDEPWCIYRGGREGVDVLGTLWPFTR